MYAEFLRSSLQCLNACIAYTLPRNLHLVYELIHQKHCLDPLASMPSRGGPSPPFRDRGGSDWVAAQGSLPPPFSFGVSFGVSFRSFLLRLRERSELDEWVGGSGTPPPLKTIFGGRRGGGGLP